MKTFSGGLRFGFASNPVKYDQLAEDEGTENDLFVSTTEDGKRVSLSRTPIWQKLGILSVIVIETTALFALLIYVIATSREPSDLDCARQLSSWCEMHS
jgi:hypothetical protein